MNGTKIVSPPQFQSQSFSSLEELREATHTVDVDFRPLTCRSAPATLFQYIEGSCLLSHTSLHCQVEQRGSLPSGTRTLALPVGQNSGLETWFGQDVAGDSLLLYPDHGEIDCVSQSGFEVFVLTLTESEILACAEHLGISEPDKWIDGTERIISCDPKARENLLSTLKAFQHYCTDQQVRLDKTVPQLSLNEMVLEKMLDMMASPASTSIKIPPKTMQRCVKRVREFVEANRYEPLRVRDLCNAASVSERTLQRVFNRYYGISPKQFIKSRRLSGLHRDLLHAESATSSVSMLAHYWGYWHMGQLARDYQCLFGELPSETLNRS